jgi:OmpA-OmpF porin, OOP family
MTSMKLLKIAAACLLVASANLAHADDDRGFYAGAGIGRARQDYFVFNGDDTAYRLFGGYSFNRYFAVEAGYLENGKIGDQFGANYLIIETSGFYASGLAKLPIGDYIVPFAKIGGYIHDDDATLVNGAQVLATDTYSDTDFIFGGGLEFNLGSNFRMRAEYEKVNLPDSAFDIVSLSATYKF